MTNTEYLRNTVDLVKAIETRFMELGARLYKIRDKELWRGDYDSYSEFLDTAHINPGHASMLSSIHKHFVVDGKIEPAKLAKVGYSVLYEAVPLIEKHGVDKAFVMASTLTRSEIKDEVRDDKHGEHTHKVGTERWGTCDKCGKFVKV